MTTPVPPTLGLVLAGGRGRRLGGADKALLPLGGRPLLAHVVERAAPQCAFLLLSANGAPQRFGPFGLTVLADAELAGAGPLAGVAAGLAWLEARRPDLDWLATFPVDCPFLPADLVLRLHERRLQAGAPLAVAMAGGRAQPAVALWSRTLRTAVDAALRAGCFRLEAFHGAHGAAWVTFGTGDPDPFTNVNSAGDLAAAEAALTAARPKDARRT